MPVKRSFSRVAGVSGLPSAGRSVLLRALVRKNVCPFDQWIGKLYASSRKAALDRLK